MIDIRVDTVLAKWGPIALSWHGLLLAAGVLIVYTVAVREGARQGLAHRSVSELALWMLLLGFAGARLLGVLADWPAYAAEPARILAVSSGGLTVTGGIVGGIAAAVLYARRRHLDAWRVLDVLAMSAPLGYVVGRVGCTINGDAWGLPTGGSWGLVYWNSGTLIPAKLLGVPTFPAPVVLQVWSLGLLGLLLALRRRSPRPGWLFAVYLSGYGTGRLLVGAWQPGEPLLLGLTFIQLVAVGLVLMGFGSMALLRAAQWRIRPEPAAASQHLSGRRSAGDI